MRSGLGGHWLHHRHCEFAGSCPRLCRRRGSLPCKGHTSLHHFPDRSGRAMETFHSFLELDGGAVRRGVEMARVLLHLPCSNFRLSLSREYLAAESAEGSDTCLSTTDRQHAWAAARCPNGMSVCRRVCHLFSR